MKLLLDSANIPEIRRFMETSAVAGVTTNPSLMAKEDKGDYMERLHEIAKIVAHPNYRDGRSRHLSVEVTTLDSEEMIKQGIELFQLRRGGLDIFVKVPLVYLNVITELSCYGNVNATACMTALQAKLAADAGAQIVSFFYNRIADEKDPEHANDPWIVLDEFQCIRPRNTKVICGSIRRKQDVFDAWNHGSDYVTASEKVIMEMMTHPQTDKAIKQFQEDIDRWRS